MTTYPDWSYFPRRTEAPTWVNEFIGVVASSRSEIESFLHRKLESDEVLAAVRSKLVDQGWEIETGKKDVDKIFRPVLFGDGGVSKVNYEIDGWHSLHKVVLEIESGRGWQGNAFFRDLIRTSLIQGADYLAVGLRTSYSYAKVKNQNDYVKARDQMDAIFASGRLQLPFEGILVFGW
jgi:hypothetical protein